MAIGAGAPTSEYWWALEESDLNLEPFVTLFGDDFDMAPSLQAGGERARLYVKELGHETPATIRARCAGYLEAQS